MQPPFQSETLGHLTAPLCELTVSQLKRACEKIRASGRRQVKGVCAARETGSNEPPSPRARTRTDASAFAAHQGSTQRKDSADAAALHVKHPGVRAPIRQTTAAPVQTTHCSSDL